MENLSYQHQIQSMLNRLTQSGHAFDVLQAESLFAGHNPLNVNSAKVLKKLGFTFVGEEFYAPTGMNHPSYVLKKPMSCRFVTQ